MTPETEAASERARIVAFIRGDAIQCDCFAREPGECACGAWDDCKRVDPLQLADRIEAGEHDYVDIPRLSLGKQDLGDLEDGT